MPTGLPRLPSSNSCCETNWSSSRPQKPISRNVPPRGEKSPSLASPATITHIVPFDKIQSPMPPMASGPFSTWLAALVWVIWVASNSADRASAPVIKTAKIIAKSAHILFLSPYGLCPVCPQRQHSDDERNRIGLS